VAEANRDTLLRSIEDFEATLAESLTGGGVDLRGRRTK
jgi:hypothetical protein